MAPNNLTRLAIDNSKSAADDGRSISIDEIAAILATSLAMGAALPTEDPAIVGALWNNAGALSVSAGPT
jgi:hypothetical protein